MVAIRYRRIGTGGQLRRFASDYRSNPFLHRSQGHGISNGLFAYEPFNAFAVPKRGGMGAQPFGKF